MKIEVLEFLESTSCELSWASQTVSLFLTFYTNDSNELQLRITLCEIHGNRIWPFYARTFGKISIGLDESEQVRACIATVGFDILNKKLHKGRFKFMDIFK